MAAVCLQGPPEEPLPRVSFPPIKFLYSRFHDSIRSELDALSHSVLALDQAAEQGLLDRLLTLKERYHFLEQVYRYHSNVEDEVVYPALNSKVKNVTSGYSVEHEDEEHLFEQLSRMLADSVNQTGKEQVATVRQLVCKVEEIHTTLRKHLAKEEEQLFPLLLEHFTHAEQAELVAQFLCCIPLTTVDVVLSWLKPAVPAQEQEELLAQVRGVVPDRLLLQLLVTWLSPGSGRSTSSSSTGGGHHPLSPLRAAAHSSRMPPSQSSGIGDSEAPPLQDIVHLHAAIRAALNGFASDVQAMQSCPDGVNASQLAGLVERHRFLRSVCMFHAASEDEVVFPVARSCVPKNEELHECEKDHVSEAQSMEDLGRLLGEVKSYARRGAKEVAGLLQELRAATERMCRAIDAHMAREESMVLPVLQASLCAAEQRAMVWRTLRAMPLRLLERVLPWLAGQLSEREAAMMLSNMRLAAPEVDSALVELLSRWAMRGRAASPEPHVRNVMSTACYLHAVLAGLAVLVHDGTEYFDNQTCCCTATRAQHQRKASPSDSHPPHPPAKRQKTGTNTSCAVNEQPEDHNIDKSAAAPDKATMAPADRNPIDHIFQFHKALKRELRCLEADALNFAAGLEAALDAQQVADMKKQLEGRFRFLWGIYHAHSESEDDIVFPALEARETLVNVSHAYTLDHQHEEQLFKDLDQVFVELRGITELPALQAIAQRMQRMCAGMRAKLEQHVRAEEQELWPLFAEHFTVEEQEDIVGRIIGRTGAEVLQAMLPWIASSFDEDEQRAMMESLRNASKNTMFDKWLSATIGAPSNPAHSPPRSPVLAPDGDPSPLGEIAPYLQSPLMTGSSQTATLAAGTFRPGWEDIFRMNQKQLVTAVRRMWNDHSLDSHRKAYLMQRIMASRYIVAQQQKRCHSSAKATSLPVGVPCRSYHTAKEGVLGCTHYKRGCQVVAPCCQRVYTCRHCHDEAEDHRLQGSDVTTMVCMDCGLRQPAAAECSGCQRSMARHYCSICRLWDDEAERSIYHCPFCNLCRLGKGLGVDACHCMRCNACMHLTEFDRHKCRDLSACPVCTEYLFDSNQPYRELPCGHFMHSHCFAQYTRYNYTCPVCTKSLGDMSVYFKMIDTLVAHDCAKLPVPYKHRRQDLLCNDCEKRSTAAFHFVYHKCGQCGSYNTRLL